MESVATVDQRRSRGHIDWNQCIICQKLSRQRNKLKVATESALKTFKDCMNQRKKLHDYDYTET